MFEVISKKQVQFDSVAKALYKSARELFGDMGLAKMALKPMADTFGQNKGVVRVNRKYVNYVKAVFCMVKKINNSPVIVRSVGVSGTLKKVSKKYSF